MENRRNVQVTRTTSSCPSELEFSETPSDNNCDSDDSGFNLPKVPSNLLLKSPSPVSSSIVSDHSDVKEVPNIGDEGGGGNGISRNFLKQLKYLL